MVGRKAQNVKKQHMSCSLQNQIIVERMREVFQKTKWKFLMDFSIKGGGVSQYICVFFVQFFSLKNI